MKRISTESIKADMKQDELFPESDFMSEPRPIKVELHENTHIFNDRGYEESVKVKQVFSKEVKRISDLIKLLSGNPFRKIEWELWNDHYKKSNNEYVNVVDSEYDTTDDDWDEKSYSLLLTSKEEDLSDEEGKEISKVLKIKPF